MKKFFSFLRWKIWDYRHPIPRRPWGVWAFVGRPGAGKTLSMVEKLQTLKQEFPRALVYTNFGFLGEDGSLEDWRAMVELDNGNDGIIFALDEANGIFNSRSWKTFPPEVFTLFAQNRHQAKMFLMTSQSFHELDKQIRTKCSYIVECKTLAGRWTFQRAFFPESYPDNPTIDEIRPRFRVWRRSFIASNAVYDAYDTFSRSVSLLRHPRADTAPRGDN
jgi:hypothetical protein